MWERHQLSICAVKSHKPCGKLHVDDGTDLAIGCVYKEVDILNWDGVPIPELLFVTHNSKE